jgi:thiaminase
MSKFLFDVQQKNRLAQKGLLKRFSITCYGHQESIEEMKAEKAAKYKELKQSKNKKLFEEWFLSYKPDDINSSVEQLRKIINKKKKTKSKIKKNGFLNLYGSKTRKNKKGIY